MVDPEKARREIKIMVIGIAFSVIGVLIAFTMPEFPGAPFPVELLVRIAGFFIFFFGFVSSVAAMLRYNRPERTSIENAAWELKRSVGKRSYVTTFVVKAFIPSICALALLFWKQAEEVGFGPQLIFFFVFLVTVMAIALIGIARITWDYNEREHAKAANRES